MERKGTLGFIMKSLRKQRGWTLKEMSARCGIPFSTLAKIEQDLLTLTYDKLQAVSAMLDISMSEFFAEGAGAATTDGPFTARRSLGLIETALRIQGKTYDEYFLFQELRSKRMIPIINRISLKSLDGFGPLLRHDGEEFTYVLEGKIVVHTEAYEPVTLSVGQSIYIDSTMGHAYLAAPDVDEARVLTICSSSNPDLSSNLATLRTDVEEWPKQDIPS